MKKLIWTLLGGLLVLSARANTIVFDSIGPAPFDSTYLYVVEAVDLPFFPAAQFTAQASGRLTEIDLPMSFTPVNPGAFSVYLYPDAAGAPDSADGMLLASTFVPYFGTDFLSLSLTGNVSVNAGSTYWLSLQPSLPGAWSFWYSSLPQIFGNVDYSSNGLTWHPFENPAPLPAFRLTAQNSRVPDSGSTIALSAISLFALFLIRSLASSSVRG